MNRRGWALVALLLASGCAGGSGGYGDDSSSGTPTPGGSSTPTPSGALYGGYVSLSRIRVETSGGPTESAVASAAFYEPFSGSAVATPALDQCLVTSSGVTPTPTPAAVVSRDAGPDVQISGPANMDLPAAMNGSFLYYQLSVPTSSIVAGGVYSVSWPGAAGGVEAKSVNNAITVPSALTVSSPDLTAGAVTVGNSALPMSWTGSSSTPAQIVLTIAPGAGAFTSISCRVADDGSFSIPASAISQLPSGNGSIGIYRSTSESHALADGSLVYFSSYWEHFGQVTK